MLCSGAASAVPIAVKGSSNYSVTAVLLLCRGAARMKLHKTEANDGKRICEELTENEDKKWRRVTNSLGLQYPLLLHNEVDILYTYTNVT